KKWLGSNWMINRHAMPLYNAYRLQALFEEKRLKVYPGLKGVEFNNINQNFTLTLEESEEHQLDKLINATGSSSQLEKMDCELVENLLKKGYLTSYPVGGALIDGRSEEHTSELQSRENLVCRLLLEKQYQI